MNKLSIKTLKCLRTLAILIGIVGGFLIWLFVPDFIKNNALFHVGNGTYGTKWGMLLLLPLPLCSLLHKNETQEYHGTDLEFQVQNAEAETRKTLLIQIAEGLGCSFLVMILMFVCTFL